MQILLNQDLTPVDLGNINPNLTVLQWLRENNLLGTKEGCAAGDCGACVAVVGEVNQQQVTYKSLNTCIALMAGLAGKHLITVEGLADGENLHPVQLAMVEQHGSQCGFCTPGFVMSLFAMYHSYDKVDIAKIKHALSGNLCRCTGYQPIINAATSAFSAKKTDFYHFNQAKIIQALQQINHQNKLSLTTKSCQFNYYAPQTITQFTQLISDNPQAKIIAGGTDLGLEVTQRFKQFTDLVNINNVAELKLITESATIIEIGAAVTLNDATSPLINSFPALASFINRFASLPIRNIATIAGNIANASPIGDMPPVLLALGAKLKITNKLTTATVNLADFYLDYKQTILKAGEFISSVIIPKLADDEQLIVHKISKRYEDDISAICMAVKIKISAKKIGSIKIALGGMAAIPKIAATTQTTVVDNWDNNNLTELSYQALKQEFTPLTDVRATTEYRLRVAAKLIEKTKLQIDHQQLLNLGDINATNNDDDKLYL